MRKGIDGYGRERMKLLMLKEAEILANGWSLDKVSLTLQAGTFLTPVRSTVRCSLLVPLGISAFSIQRDYHPNSRGLSLRSRLYTRFRHHPTNPENSLVNYLPRQLSK